jgi:periplasmic protein TonB
VMGGGGGQKGPTPVTHGTPPQFAPQQLNPPKIAVDDAKLTPPVTVDVDPSLKMMRNDALPIGVMNSPLPGVSMGNGNGSGIGSGSGNGIGPGSGGGIGGALRRVGGRVSAPEVLFKPEAEFSEEARRTKTSGDVIVYLQVGVDGLPHNLRVVRGIGMGLDEKALETVRLYRFRPAMENGHPVPVEMNIDVEFHIY